MDNITDRQTAELERSVIGALCIEPKLASKICGLCREEDFTSSLCQKIFVKAAESVHFRSPFDAVIAVDAVAKDLGEKDARAFVSGCMTITPTTANAEYHAKMLHNRATITKLKQSLVEDIMGSVDDDPETLAANVIGKCRDYLSTESASGQTVSLMQALTKMYSGLGESKGMIRVDTGFTRLDSILKGIWSGNLCIIGARPGVGKSAMALSIAEHTAKHTGKVIIYSMEMLDVEIAERITVRNGKIALDDLIDSQNLTQEQYAAISSDCSRMSSYPIYINDSPHMTVNKIRKDAASMDDLKLIIVDFLSLMKSDRQYEKHYLELGAISRGLKNLAAELKIPVIALCQLNREREENERPTLANLRDSGELEQNANKVLLMWNEDKENQIVGVSVAKNRRGKTGSVSYRFDGAHMLFSELDTLHEPPPTTRGTRQRKREKAWDDDE